MPERKSLDQNISRLAAVHGLKVLDSGSEKVYDEITELTAELCEAPICLISLVDEDRQWFKSEVGLGLSETKIEQSICAHAIKQDSFLEVSDTHLDPRTVDNSLCQGDKAIRFYAGAILRTLEGWPLGTLCILDYKPRKLTDIQRRILQVHANSVTRQLELTKALMNRAILLDHKQDQSSVAPEAARRHKKTKAQFEKLTPREKDVLNLIAGQSRSLSSKEIALELGISFRTVHHHRAHIMTKMEVASVAELITVCIKAGIYN